MTAREAAIREKSGYGLLLRTVAKTLQENDPGAAQALIRAADDVESFVAELAAARDEANAEREKWKAEVVRVGAMYEREFVAARERNKNYLAEWNACEERERLLREALERLASAEGFTGAGILDKTFSGRECRARIAFARDALVTAGGANVKVCGAKYGKRPWPDATCQLRPGHDGDHEAEAWDLSSWVRWSEPKDDAALDAAGEQPTTTEKCTCPVFKRRGTCRHIRELKASMREAK